MKKNKGLLLLIAAGILAVSALTAAAEEGTAEPETPEIAAPAVLAEGTCGDNLTWVLDEEGTLTISGEGDMWDFENSSSAPWYSNRSKIKKVVMEDSVTSVGDYAFDGYNNSYSYYPNLTEVIFPESLTSIGYEAFRDCDNLKTITIQSNVSISSNNFNTVEKLILSDNVTSVDSYFRYITTLTEIQVDDTDGKGLVSIDGVLYDYDSHLESYTLIRYPASRPESSYTVIDGTEIIAEYAFCNADLLEEVIFPDSLIELEGYVFSGCDNLSTVTFGKYITTVDGGAFSDNSSITKVVLPAALKTHPSTIRNISTLTEFEVPDAGNTGYRDIDGVLYYYNAAEECLTLIKYPKARTDTEYTIADGTAVIGSSAFSSNSYLTKITFPDSVEEIQSSAFYNCTALTEIDLNDGLTSIGSDAFAYCSGLMTVNFPETLTSIGSSAFIYCSGLMTVNFPETLTSIGSYAFAYCTYLKEISLPESLTTISSGAFYGCNVLRAAYFYGNAPTYFYSSDVFTNTHPTFTIYYNPNTSGWSTPTWKGYPAEPGVYPDPVIKVTYSSALGKLFDSGNYNTAKLMVANTDSAETVVWSVDDSSVLNIDADGKITAIRAGTTTVYAQFGDTVLSAEITVYPNVIEYIKIDESRTRLSYTEGEEISKSDITVNAVWSDSSKTDLSDFTFTPGGVLTTSDSKLTVTAGGKTASASLKVSAIVLPVETIEVILPASGKEYAVGSKFKTSDLVLEITFTDGTKSVITGSNSDVMILSHDFSSGSYTFSQTDADEGTVVFRIAYRGKNTEIAVNVVERPDTGASFGFAFGKNTFYEGETFTADIILDGTLSATSLAFSDFVLSSEAITLTGTEWLLKNGVIADVDMNNGTAVIAYDQPVDMTGAILRLTLKAGELQMSDSCEISCSVFAEINGVRTEMTVSPETFEIADYLRGDTNGDGTVNSADAIYLLRYTMLPERYPLNGVWFDYDNDGNVTAEDAVYLLYHAMLPGKYPLIEN